jgi:hypothetical protein
MPDICSNNNNENPTQYSFSLPLARFVNSQTMWRVAPFHWIDLLCCHLEKQIYSYKMLILFFFLHISSSINLNIYEMGCFQATWDKGSFLSCCAFLEASLYGKKQCGPWRPCDALPPHSLLIHQVCHSHHSRPPHRPPLESTLDPLFPRIITRDEWGETSQSNVPFSTLRTSRR